MQAEDVAAAFACAIIVRLKEDECSSSMRKLETFFEEARLLRGVEVSEACRQELETIVRDDVDRDGIRIDWSNADARFRLRQRLMVFLNTGVLEHLRARDTYTCVFRSWMYAVLNNYDLLEKHLVRPSLT